MLIVFIQNQVFRYFYRSNRRKSIRRMLLILNTVFVITISLTNGDLITFEINEKLCSKRTQFFSKNNEQLDVLEISFATNESCYEFNLVTDSLQERPINRELIDKAFLSNLEFSDDYVNDRKIVLFTNKLDRNNHYVQFLLEIEEIKKYSKQYPEYFMLADNYLYLVAGIYFDNPQNSEHYPVKITVEKRNDFSELLKRKLNKINYKSN